MNEQELQQSLRTLEFYRAQLESFDQQFEFLAMTLKEHNRAKDTMEGYKNLKGDSETLVPIGASSYVFAKVSSPDKALVGIGADVLIETGMDEAIAKYENRMKEIEDAMKSLNERYKEIASKAGELTAAIQNAYDGK